jgi:hypothetical protein
MVQRNQKGGISMFDNPFNLGLLVVTLYGIGGALVVVLMVKFFERRDRRRAERYFNSWSR